MPIPAYRAKQSTDTAGTGTIALNAAGTNARSFAAAYGASARRVMYAISWASGFELGLGDFDGGTPGSLTRVQPLASSNAGALVTLPAGTKDVFAVFDPAAREVLIIGSGTSTIGLFDLGNVVVFTGVSASTLNLPALASVPIGAGFLVWNTGTAALTIDPNGAETVNGAATLAVQAGGYAEVLRLSVGGWSASVPALPSTGQALGAAGSAAAPFYSFAGDPDTGIYNVSPNVMAAVVGGGRALTVADGTLTLDANLAGDTSVFLRNNTASSSVNRAAIIGTMNESSVVVAALNTIIQSDGGSRWYVESTPAGSRSSDRRAIGIELTASGDFKFNSGYGSAALAFGVRAWVNFNGTGTVAIRGSGGVTSITDNGAGDYTVNFNFTMPGTNYAATVSAGNAGTLASTNATIGWPAIYSTTSLRIGVSDNNADTNVDVENVNVIVVR
jgi:hypothetical protein